MSELQDKYASVITAAQGAGISNLQVQEQDGILYVSGSASNSAAKDAVWNALGVVDPNFYSFRYQCRCTGIRTSCRYKPYGKY